MWWAALCDRDFFADEAAFQAAEKDFRANNPYALWVDAGDPAPTAAVVSGETLAQAAWDAVDIPAPTVGTSPDMDGEHGTVVGVDTWVWATGETPSQVKVTATAGNSSATVTATSTGLNLTAPDSEASCHGFGTPWTPGTPEGTSDCTVTFTRSSAHLGGTTPLNVSASYDATWTATDGTNGTLGTVTTNSTTPITVHEIQTINR